MKKLAFFILAILFSVMGFAQTNAVPKPTFSPGGKLENVFDRFGKKYKLDDIRVGGTRISKKGKTLRTDLLPCDPNSMFELYFETDSGMETPAGAVFRDVVCRVFNDISNFIQSPLHNPGNTNKIRIWVRDIREINNNSNTLGVATAFHNMPGNNNPTNFGGIVDNEIWKTIHTGVDSYTNVVPPIFTSTGSLAFYHGQIGINFRNNNITWNTNLTGTGSPNGNTDLYSVVLHEVTHALGFASYIDVNDRSQVDNPAGTGNFNYFTRYDQFLRNSNGDGNRPLIANTTPAPLSTMYNYYFNTGGSLSAADLSPPSPGNCLSTTFCPNALRYISSIDVPVYTPECFENGSSLSHFEDICYPKPLTPIQLPLSLTWADNSYFVMSDSYGTSRGIGTGNEPKRFLQPEERQVLCDIGYTVNDTFGTGVSFHNYNTSVCPGITVAGVNDGLDNIGNFIYFEQPFFAIELSPTTHTNTTPSPNSIFFNDINTTGFEGLQDVYDPTATFNGTVLTSLSSNTVNNFRITFHSGVEGLHLLRYVPINVATGQRGNITYVYVFVRAPEVFCVNPTHCNLVVNGDFEATNLPNGSFNQIERACRWGRVDATTTTPDYIVGLECNPRGGEPDRYSPAKRAYAGIWTHINGGIHYNEIIRTRLSSPLLANTIYRLSFDVSLAETSSLSAFQLQAYLSRTLLPDAANDGINMTNLNMLRTNPTFSERVNGWETIVMEFTTDSTGGEEFLYIGGLSRQTGGNPGVVFRTIVPVPISTTLCPNNTSGPGLDNAYYYIDNVVLIPTNGAALNLPTTICQNRNLDLPDYLTAVTQPGGIFDVDGTPIGNDFIPANFTAGLHTITYSFTYANGCTAQISDTITITAGCVLPYISQTYAYNANDNYIEVKNDNAQAIAAGAYFLAVYRDGALLTGAPTAFVPIGNLPAQGVEVFRNTASSLPAYATGFTNGFAFDGSNDIVIITTSTDANAYTNRIDIVGNFNTTTPWGVNTSLVRSSCALIAPPRIAFDREDWVDFTEAEINGTSSGINYGQNSLTNAVLGRHFDTPLRFEFTNTWNEINILNSSPAINESMPDRSREIQLNSDYCTGTNSTSPLCTTAYGDFEACSLTVGTLVTLTITATHYVKVQISVQVLSDGALIIEDQGSLIMVKDTFNGISGTDLIDLGTNSTLQISTSTKNALTGRYDYVYWSTPLSDNLSNPKAKDIFNFGDYPGRQFAENRFYLFQNQNYCDIYNQYPVGGYQNDAYDDNFDDYMPFTHPQLVTSDERNKQLKPGRGYATWPPVPPNGTDYNYSITFTGEMNNGKVFVPMFKNNSAEGSNSHLVGNPYPSPIDLDIFFAQNSLIIEPIAYIWTRLNSQPGSGNPGPNGLNYSEANFSVYTMDMTLNTRNNGPFAGGSTLASSQSFFVRTYKDFSGFANAPIAPRNRPYDATETPTEEILPAGTLEFNNSMRTTAPNITFSRMATGRNNSSDSTGDKLWLDLTDSNDYNVQLGIYFKPTGSAGFIEREDVKSIQGRKYNFYTLSTPEDLIIDVQDSFTIDKSIPLGMLNASGNSSQLFTISIPQKSGVFNTQTVYLEDSLLGIVHNLSTSSYSFNTSEVVTEGRFKLIFSNSLRNFTNKKSTPENEVALSIENETLRVVSKNKKIQSVQVFDIYTPNSSGILLKKTESINSNEVALGVPSKYKLLSVRIILEDGSVINKKIMR